jgi:hypothetical protein
LRFAETVEKDPLLAGFFVFDQTDLGLRSRKCVNFGPWSLVAKFPFLPRFRLVEIKRLFRESIQEGLYPLTQPLYDLYCETADRFRASGRVGWMAAERRKSTVHKPSAPSAKLANDFENRPVHSPPDQREMEADYEWEGCFGKRAPLPHYRFIVSADCSVPS